MRLGPQSPYPAAPPLPPVLSCQAGQEAGRWGPAHHWDPVLMWTLPHPHLSLFCFPCSLCPILFCLLYLCLSPVLFPGTFLSPCPCPLMFSCAPSSLFLHPSCVTISYLLCSSIPPNSHPPTPHYALLSPAPSRVPSCASVHVAELGAEIRGDI